MPETFTFEEAAQPETFSFEDAGYEIKEPNRAAFRPPTGELSTTYGGPTLSFEPRAMEQTMADIASEVYGLGVGDPQASLLGIAPQIVPSGKELTKSTGVPLPIAIPASAVGRAGAALGQYVTSPKGIKEQVTAFLPGIGLLQRAKWFKDMAQGAGETAGNLSALVEKALKNPSKVTADDWQAIADDTANTALMLFGAGKLSSHEFARMTGIRAPLGRMVESEKTRFSKDLAEKLKQAEPAVEQATPQAQRQLGIPISTLPTSQPGMRELVDAALRERTQLIQIPGQEGQALAALQRAVEPPQILPQEGAPAIRVPGGGPAPYGRVSYRREAEAPLPERTQQAIDLEKQAEQARIAAERMQREAEASFEAEPKPPPVESGKAEPQLVPVEAVSPRIEAQPAVAAAGERPAISETKPTAEKAQVQPVDVSQVESVPATENGGRIAIVLPDGTAVVGGRIHADAWNKAIDAGVATDAQLADGMAGFVKPDGTAWGVNGKPLPKVSKVIIVGSEQPKPPALPTQRPPEPPKPPTKVPDETQRPKEGLPEVTETPPPTPAAAQGRQPDLAKPTPAPAKPAVEGKVEPAMSVAELQTAVNKQRGIVKRSDPYKKKGKEAKAKLEQLEAQLREAQSGPSIAATGPVYWTRESRETDIRRVKPTTGADMGERVRLASGQVWEYKGISGYAADNAGRVNGWEKVTPPPMTEPTPPPATGEGGAPTKGIITGRAIEKWADDTLRGGATHLGPDVLAAYMVKGAALIERGVINFAEWSAKMIESYGDSIKPHLNSIYASARSTVNRTPVEESGTLRSAREIVEQRLASQPTPTPAQQISAMTEGEAVKMRRSAARATESPAIPKPVQQRVSTAPESYYKVQPEPLVERAVKGMNEADLATVPADSNLFVAARLELANRLFNAGEMDKGYQVFVELEKQGTSFGQNINQFKRLPGTLPEHTAFVLNQKLKSAGKDPLTKEQEAVAIKLTKASKQSDILLDQATDAWVKNPTAENAAKAQAALLKANNDAIVLQRFVGKFQPRGTASVLKSILQGNLLTPISEVANLFGNMSFLPFRALDRSVASGFDIIDNAITGRRREVSVSPIGGTTAAAAGAGRGLSKVPEILFRGTGDTIKGETHAGLHPVRAWINQFSKNPEMPTTGGKLTIQDRINLALEGTFGVPAEVMLRGLGAGDAPFKEAARGRVIAEQLRLHKVPESQWKFATDFPELFFDRATMEQIKADTLAAVFQRNSKTIGHLMNWIRGRGDVFDLAVATVAPYKLTPWNLVGEILSYNPVVAFSRAAIEAKRGNTRAAKLNAGKFVAGSLLTAAGWWLYQNGLLSPSLDERNEAQKARVLSDQVMPANHINISGLKRKLSGGDPSFKPGDHTVDIFRAGGLAGSIFYMTANIGRDFERQPETQSLEHLGAIIRQSTLEQARFGLNQSFLSGVEGIITAVKDGNTDNYVRQYMNTVLSIPMPNSMATLSRATRKNQPDFRAEGFAKQVENTVRNKLGFAGLDDYLPLKRGLWGEPLPQTPKGANELFYHFFDISKHQQVTDDPVPLELYRLWRATADTRAIPSLPEKTLTIGGTTYALTPEQRSRYAELVGQYRRQMADAIVINPVFHKLSNESKLNTLDSLYRKGLESGKAVFWLEARGKLQPKAERAGFK